MKLHKLFFFCVFSGVSLVAFGQTTKELNRKKEALQREIELANKNLNKTINGKRLTLTQINTIKAQIRLRQEKISTINSEMKNLDHQITENTGKVHNLQSRLVDLKKEYAQMIRFAQRNRNSYDKMMFIFAANDFNQAYKRIKYLQQFGQYRKKQAAYIQGTEKDLSHQIEVLDKNLKSKNTLLKEEQTEKSRLDKDRSEQAVVLNKLSKQERQYKQDIQKKRQQQSVIDREIKAAIKRELEIARKKAEEEAREAARLAAAKAKAENKPVPTQPVTQKQTEAAFRSSPEGQLSAAFENNRGSLPWPVEKGYITSHFGIVKVDQATDNHTGIIFQTSEGAAVRAVFGGTVTNILPIYGKFYVIVKHGEYFTVYENLKSVSVAKGTKVSTKQTLGVAGLTDGVTEVGFQIHRKGIPQNPEGWIAR